MPLSRYGYGPVGRLANPPVNLLVCFAVKEEMRFFSCQSGNVQIWITGMGRRNAGENIRDALARVKPKRAITAGFAGGLNPRLKAGDVVYEEDSNAGFARELDKLGAIDAKLHCHGSIAVTVAQKGALWRQTGADAVEMESGMIRAICRQSSVPSATVRVISDEAGQDLPLDFNALMTSDDRINYFKLMLSVIRRPGRIAKLIEFQHQTQEAARKLGAVLEGLLGSQRL